MLLDTTAHVSVLPKQLLAEKISLPLEEHAKRHVRVFGREEIALDGQVHLNITICGVHLVHRFFYVDAEISAIGGYDLLRAAHIIIDAQSAEVSSKHPDVVHPSSISENIFATVQPYSIPNSKTPTSTPANVQVSCVTTDTTSCVQKDTLPIVTDDGSHSFSFFTPTLVSRRTHRLPPLVVPPRTD